MTNCVHYELALTRTVIVGGGRDEYPLLLGFNNEDKLPE